MGNPQTAPGTQGWYLQRKSLHLHIKTRCTWFISNVDTSSSHVDMVQLKLLEDICNGKCFWHLQWLLVIEGHWEEHMFSSCYQPPLGNSWHYWWRLLKAASYDTSVLTKNLSLIQFFSECPPCQYLAFVRLASDGRQGRWGGLKKIARNTTIATKSLYYVSPLLCWRTGRQKEFWSRTQ